MRAEQPTQGERPMLSGLQSWPRLRPKKGQVGNHMCEGLRPKKGQVGNHMCEGASRGCVTSAVPQIEASSFC